MTTPARRSTFALPCAVLTFAALASAGVVAAAAAAPGEAYAVKLDRPVKVGQRFAVTVKADVDRTIKVDVNGQAQPDRVEKFTAELAGTVRVEAVNDKTGVATKVQLTVDKLTRDGDEAIPAGAVVVGERAADDPTFTVNGTAADADQAAVLTAVVELGRADATVGQDAMFGTPQPRRAGDTWAGDPAKIAQVLAPQVPVSAEHAKGTGTLVEVKTVGGGPAEVVETTVTVDPLTEGRTIKQLTVTGGTFRSTLTRTMPVDLARPAVSSDEHVTLKMTGTAGNGAATVDVSVERTVHRTTAEAK